MQESQHIVEWFMVKHDDRYVQVQLMKMTSTVSNKWWNTRGHEYNCSKQLRPVFPPQNRRGHVCHWFYDKVMVNTNTQIRGYRLVSQWFYVKSWLAETLQLAWRAIHRFWYLHGHTQSPNFPLQFPVGLSSHSRLAQKAMTRSFYMFLDSGDIRSITLKYEEEQNNGDSSIKCKQQPTKILFCYTVTN